MMEGLEMIEQFDWEQLKTKLPELLSRKIAVAALPVFSAGTLANFDSKGEGPERLTIGKKIFYPRDSFVEWLKSRTKKPKAGKIN